MNRKPRVEVPVPFGSGFARPFPGTPIPALGQGFIPAVLKGGYFPRTLDLGPLGSVGPGRF